MGFTVVCTPQALAVAQRALREGQTITEAAKAAGVSRASLHRYAKMGILDVRKPVKEPKMGVAFRVPKWVSPDERADYHDNFVLYGEHKAASIARAMRAEARRREA